MDCRALSSSFTSPLPTKQPRHHCNTSTITRRIATSRNPINASQQHQRETNPTSLHPSTTTTTSPPGSGRPYSFNIRTAPTKAPEKEEKQKETLFQQPSSSGAIRIRSRRPPQRASLTTTLCDTLDGFINNFIDGPLPPSVDSRHVLAGNFAPVDELAPVSCPVVKGSIPRCLGGGSYIRNGPNPQHLPLGPHHLFDGDGILHSLLLPAGGGRASATFCSRFVHTNKYLASRKAGRDVLPSTFGSMHGLPGIARFTVSAARMLTGQVNPLDGIGPANTSMVYFTDRLLALGESDLPYAVHLSPDDGDLTTVGRLDFGGGLAMAMTAHPKKDPITRELFAFRYSPLPPFLTYFWFDRHGNKVRDVSVFGMRQPSFVHDFAITERHAIFADIQIMMKPMDMLLGGGLPVGPDAGKVPRVGVLPRYATSEEEMRWFETPGFNPIHVVNAWDEDDGGAVVLVAPNILSPEHALERSELVHASMEMVRINLRDGTVVRTPLSAWNLEFPVVNPFYVGRKNRYAYAGIGDPMPKVAGVAKLDYGAAVGRGGECVAAVREYGPGCFGGEPFFVPNITDDEDGVGGKEEDDGYLVSYIHDEVRNESKFVVMDAKAPDLEIVAEVLLPRRVPYGFHGLFVNERELKQQRKQDVDIFV